jgi:hypothetical protein
MDICGWIFGTIAMVAAGPGGAWNETLLITHTHVRIE